MLKNNLKSRFLAAFLVLLENYEDWLVTMAYKRGLFDGKYMERATNYMLRNEEVFTDERFKNTLELQALAFYSSNCEFI